MKESNIDIPFVRLVSDKRNEHKYYLCLFSVRSYLILRQIVKEHPFPMEVFCLPGTPVLSTVFYISVSLLSCVLCIQFLLTSGISV